MTAQAFLAEQIERIGDSLAHYLETTAPDRLHWQPQFADSAPTRSPLEQAAECIGTNRYFAALLRGESDPPTTRDSPEPTPADPATARARLQASCAELAAAVRALDDAGLERTYIHLRGPRTGKSLMTAAYRNMAYHSGQINLIQMLAGDAEFHIPASWM